jgi:small subunit ribosomal protein S16
MAVAIRLQRIGRPKQAFYRIVAVDSRRPAQGKPKEILGSYNPRAAKAKEKVTVKQERYDYWIGVGAKPSSTVASLLKAAGSKSAEEAQTKVKAKARKKAEAKAKAAEEAKNAPKEEAAAEAPAEEKKEEEAKPEA